MLNEAEHGITDLAMNNSRFHGDETLLVKFYKRPKENSAKSAEAGRPIFEDVPYIQIMTPGNKDSIVIRPATKMDKQRFAEHYRKFEAREDQEGIEGTLLDEWAGISRSQCEELKYLNIRTVEQLVAVSDANAQNVMGINFLKQKATKYLEDTKGDVTAAALADMQAKYDALVAQMSETPKEGGGIPGYDILPVSVVADAVEEPEEDLSLKAPRKRRTKAEMEAARAAE